MLKILPRTRVALTTVVLVGWTSTVEAAIETQIFDTEPAAAAAGWIGVDNRNATFANDFGFANSNEAGGLSGPGEAGGFFARRSIPWGYYVDTSIGNLSLDDALSASGRIVYHQETMDGGIRVGWLNNNDRSIPAPAMVGMQILEANRHQAMVSLNDQTVIASALQSGGIGPVATTFSLAWDPVDRVATATVGGITNVTPMLSEAEMMIGADLNAFGLFNGHTSTSNPSQRARLFIDDLTYTSAGPTAADQTIPQLRINRFSGATRIFGAGGADPTELDEYIASSAPDTPPLENVWIPSNWNSITDQEGGTWSEGSSTAQQLSEVNLSGSITVNPGSAIQLGNIYDPSSFEEDITFSYGLAGEGFVRPGHVLFEGGLELRVNKDAGNITILNPEAVNIGIDGYVIQSASGVLDEVGWDSLEDQTISGWEEIVSSSSTDLSEVNFTSSTVVNSGGGLLDLGAAYGGGLAGTEDLRFTYSLAGGLTVIEGMVRYVTGLLVGDYNNNGTVDAADYVVWRRAMGAGATSLPNRDPSQSGPVDGDDYAFWQGNFGKTSGGSGATDLVSVPEPAAWLVLLMGMAMFGVQHRSCR